MYMLYNPPYHLETEGAKVIYKYVNYDMEKKMDKNEKNLKSIEIHTRKLCAWLCTRLFMSS